MSKYGRFLAAPHSVHGLTCLVQRTVRTRGHLRKSWKKLARFSHENMGKKKMLTFVVFARNMRNIFFKADAYAIRFGHSDFHFPFKKKVFWCSPIVQNPTGQSLIWKSDGPSRQILTPNLTTRPIGFSNRKMATVFDKVKIYLSSAWYTAVVRGTH